MRQTDSHRLQPSAERRRLETNNKLVDELVHESEEHVPPPLDAFESPPRTRIAGEAESSSCSLNDSPICFSGEPDSGRGPPAAPGSRYTVTEGLGLCRATE